MTSSLSAKVAFLKVAANSPQYQEELSLDIEEKTFSQILKPIETLLNQEPAYGQHKTETYQKMQELRQICNEAQVYHTTDDTSLKQRRNDLSDTLQELSESLQETVNGKANIKSNNITGLPNLVDIIKSDAKIYKEFMGYPLVAEALDQVADNITSAEVNLWYPNDIDLNKSANDEIYAQQDIA